MAIFLLKTWVLWWVLAVIVIVRWFSVVSSWGPDEEASERALPLTGQLPGGRQVGEQLASRAS